MTVVKDFVQKVSTKKASSLKTTTTKTEGVISSGKIKKSGFIIKLQHLGLVVGLVFLVILLIRNFQFADLFRHQEAEAMLVVFQKVDKSAAYILGADFKNLRLDVYPVNTDVEVLVGDYGFYRFQAIYPLLSSIEKKPFNFVRSTYSFSLGTILDTVWLVNEPLKNWQNGVDIRQEFFSKELLNLPLNFSHKLAWLALTIDARTEIFFHPTLEKLPLTKNLSGLSTTSFVCSVALVNTTSTQGLAGKIDDLLHQGNFSVVRVTNSTQELNQTQIIINTNLQNNGDCKNVQAKIEKIVPGKIEYIEDDSQTQQYRADLVVKLGNDIVK
ncbi:MAG: hypothetical protein COU63_04055 [Candidatus Pacebacteria bacterium CG10_big_fil_rev_8_21_14_0_10_36_11]|nr:LytR C-terminal domain-containing protein [Candidatus Pacearchaeota archaeon]OIP74069.1 MAG: hypothetical protein AUK08_02330 [Candidatus Pacebacteria bacterium CG2_30_36_39]PIR64436.1 MAG: hypothetical protein COU63_04055 [Candidatus Pacebacteria bacterium CG10_big_fil_rev_8_21_14_0_10_36_11]PJC42773.1 MAG: hypothetical protein CO040_02695 [Candidatus Pacebacteria bacterium CG_4_9_14_0_2_um_filter_36_8]